MIYDFLRMQLRRHLEVAPHITLYFFEHRAACFEMSDLKQRVETQAKPLNQTEKTFKYLWARVDYLIEKFNIIGKK